MAIVNKSIGGGLEWTLALQYVSNTWVGIQYTATKPIVIKLTWGGAHAGSKIITTSVSGSYVFPNAISLVPYTDTLNNNTVVQVPNIDYAIGVGLQ